MEPFFQQISSILVTAPGNLIYHIVLAFCLAASLQAALLSSRRADDAHGGRLILGLSLVLVAQFVLFAASGLAWQQVADAHRYAPPLDRAVTAFSLVWIVWLWVFPKPHRLADVLAALLSLAIVMIAVYTLNAWQTLPANTPFNGSPFDWYWELSSLITVALGLLALLIARPPYWGVGLASLSLLVAGYIINLLAITPSGDYSGTVRLGQLTAYLMLPVLAQRLLYTAPQPVLEISPDAADSANVSSGVDLRLAQTWSALAAETDPQGRVVALAHAVAQSLRADLCFLLSSPAEDGLWKIPGGYDLVTDEALTAAAVEAERIPALSNALQRGKTLRILPEDTGKAELAEVGRLFGLEDAGSLAAAPLISSGKVWGGIVLLSPYGHLTWDEEALSFLTNLSETLTQALQSSPAENAQQTRLEEALHALQGENQALNAQLAGLRQQKPNVDVESLLAVQQEAQEAIAQLQAENEELRARQAAPAAGRASEEQMEGELRLLLQEVALLKNQLAQANMELEKACRGASRPSAAAAVTGGQDMVTSIAQDLRQPMSGIMGYADLLLADSAGPLTAEQRIFLDRVRSAAERLRSMVNDLVRAAALAGGGSRLEKEPVDLEAVINEAVAYNNALLREKNITLRIDLPEELPVIAADQQALQQILVDLLRNAGSITPDGGEVLLQVGLEETDGRRRSVLFQVTDSGGGIAGEDLERVFKPQHRAGEALIEGTADAGSGLPVVAALVKAQGGEVWVETTSDKAARFSVRLPIEDSIPTGGREAT